MRNTRPDEWYRAVTEANTSRNIAIVRAGKWSPDRPYLPTKSERAKLSNDTSFRAITKQEVKDIEFLMTLSKPPTTDFVLPPRKRKLATPPAIRIEEDYDAMMDYAIARDYS